MLVVQGGVWVHEMGVLLVRPAQYPHPPRVLSFANINSPGTPLRPGSSIEPLTIAEQSLPGVSSRLLVVDILESGALCCSRFRYNSEALGESQVLEAVEGFFSTMKLFSSSRRLAMGRWKAGNGFLELGGKIWVHR